MYKYEDDDTEKKLYYVAFANQPLKGKARLTL